MKCSWASARVQLCLVLGGVLEGSETADVSKHEAVEPSVIAWRLHLAEGWGVVGRSREVGCNFVGISW